MATAGRKAQVKVSGTAVSFTDEATTSSDDQTYQITATTKRVWDRTVTITVEEDGVATEESYTVNRLTGAITFDSVDALRGDVTVTGSYLPLSVVGEAFEYSWSGEGDNQDKTAFGDDYIKRIQGLKDFTSSLSKFYVDSTFVDHLTDGAVVVLEFYVDSSSAYDVRAWAICSSNEISASVDGLVEESIEFEGTGDADRRVIAA